MKENAFGRDDEPIVTHSPGNLRAAPVTKLQRPTKAREPDVDALVTDFLEALDTYSSEEPGAAETSKSKIQVHDALESALSAGGVLEKGMPATEAGNVQSEGRIPQADVDADLAQTLREIELRPRLSQISTPAHEIAKIPSDSPAGGSKAVRTSESHSQLPTRTAEISIVKAETVSDAPPAKKVRVAAESHSIGWQDSRRLPITSYSHVPLAKRRLVIGVTAVIVIAVICLGVYLFIGGKSDLTKGASGTPAQIAASTPSAIGTESGATVRQAAPDAVALKGGAPSGATQNPPQQPTRSATSAPAAKAPVPPARDDNNRTKASPTSNVTGHATGLEVNASVSSKQIAPPPNEDRGNSNAAANPIPTSPPSSASTEVKPTESSISAPVQTSVTAAPPGKSNEEPPAAAKVPTPPPLPAGGSLVTTDPAASGGTTTSATAAKPEPSPLATPALAVSKVAPVYPLAAKNLKITGTVDVRVSIDEQGKVTKATALNGQYLLRTAAEDALLKWKFKPATLRGANVKSDLVVSVSFVK